MRARCLRPEVPKDMMNSMLEHLLIEGIIDCSNAQLPEVAKHIGQAEQCPKTMKFEKMACVLKTRSGHLYIVNGLGPILQAILLRYSEVLQDQRSVQVEIARLVKDASNPEMWGVRGFGFDR